MIEIAGQRIAAGERCCVIAEAGVNHDGDVARAVELVDAAAEAGADAVKFQTWITEELVTADAPSAGYQRVGAAADGQFRMLKQLELPFEAFRTLQEHAGRRGVGFLSTPDDERSAEFLVELGVPALKVSSPEIRNLPYLRFLARLGRPLVVSTGMSSLDDVASAVAAIEGEGNRELVLLHCVSSYPAAAADANLRAMDALAQAFGYPVGFSDHTVGVEVSLAAVARGACVIEKHLTLDRSLPGPDHATSLEPDSFRALVDGIRTVESALGDGVKRPTASEADAIETMQKRVVARRAIAAGEVLGEGDLALRRTRGGVPATELPRFVGRRAARPLAENEPLADEAVE